MKKHKRWTPKKYMSIKHSIHRKRLAMYLKIWKKTRSMSKTAKELKINSNVIWIYLQFSKAYQRHQNRKKYTKTDRIFAQRWAFKIRAVKFAGGKCEKCGNKNIFQLEFHHHKKDKESGVSILIHNNGGWDNIQREVKKCHLLCCNCHGEEHVNKDKFNQLSQLIYRYVHRKKKEIIFY